MFKYFTFGENETIDSLKKQYWKLARQYHPDFNGGNEEANQAMKDVIAEYEKALQELGKEKKKNYRLDQEFIDIIDKIISLNMQGDVTIEICGWFIYVYGEGTKPYKDQLNRKTGVGLYWNPKKQVWYWKPAWYKSRNRNAWSMDQIRSVYGSETVKQEQQERERLTA